MKTLTLFALCCSLHAGNHLEETFNFIYDLGTWDDSGFSLSGSHIEVMQPYVDFLESFFVEHDIHSVVDVGCGDWAFSRYIDWSKIEYLGIDIVKSVIERNQKLFVGPNITFVHGNAITMDLPEADLLICKDTFQHLSNHHIMCLLKQMHKFKHCLFTDYVDKRTLSSTNQDIKSGSVHMIDLSQPPFNLPCKKVLLFQGIGAPKLTVHIERAHLDQDEL